MKSRSDLIDCPGCVYADGRITELEAISKDQQNTINTTILKNRELEAKLEGIRRLLT